jgi:CheY-like chemotaxis protein
MKRIRSQIKFKRLPVIALTAKAMKDDKQNVSTLEQTITLQNQ